MDIIKVKQPEIPEDGWFHDHLMKVLLGEETFNMIYPKQRKSRF